MVDKSPSRIPTPVSNLRRSASVRVRGERPVILYSTSPTPFPSIAEKEELSNEATVHWTPNRFSIGVRSHSQASGLNRRDDDLESVESLGSNVSGLSRVSTRSSCDHSLFAKNGTTFSGRSNKYVVHCSEHGHTEEYLTPTQRANRNIRRLKTLLQLAKEKLLEKEKEIFRLTKEVVELKVFKASIRNADFSDVSTPSDCKDSPRTVDCGDVGTYTVDETRDLGTDTFADLTPIQTSRSFIEKLDNEEKLLPSERLSPSLSPLHCFQRDKMSGTPDYLLSSLADSGHFDDLASSLSLQSKDSLNLNVSTEEKRSVGENSDREEERTRLVKMYEAILSDRRDTYERELQSVKKAHEEDNLRILDSFETKLKEEERKFEDKFRSLLKSTEEEKIEIVERFEKKLDEAKREHLMQKCDALESFESNGDMYMLKLEEEKAIYEKALSDIKSRFNEERLTIEKCFDDAMSSERRKFEETVSDIRAESDKKIQNLNEKMTDYEAKYNELLEKYHCSLEKISQLEESNKILLASLEEQNERQKEMYLKMYLKGQEAVQFQREEEGTSGSNSHSNIPVPELLVQLKVTEVELENLKDNEYRAQHKDEQGGCLLSAKEALSLWMLAARKAMYKRLAETQRPQEATTATQPRQDAEATLHFLKSAVYYFLTDRDNHLDHLRAIERILGFSQAERRNIAAQYTY